MWADPILGARLGVKLGGPWSVTVAGDVGGFGVGSRLTWQGLGSVNYAWSESLTLKAGYRALHVDYRSGGFFVRCDAARSRRCGNIPVLTGLPMSSTMSKGMECL